MEVPSFHTGCLPWFLFSWLRVSCTRELCCSSGLVQCHKYLVRTYSAAGFLNLSAIDILTLSNSLLCNAVLCIVGCLAAPLASTHQMLIVFPNLPHPPFSLHNVYRHCPMSSGVKLLLLENHWESPSPLQITPPWVTLFWFGTQNRVTQGGVITLTFADNPPLSYPILSTKSVSCWN